MDFFYFKIIISMAKYESKVCTRCNEFFECKSGNITQCQCFDITFSEEEREYLYFKYNDCLCIKCLLSIQNELKK